MARRGLAILFAMLGVAFLISIVGFAALYFLVGREPSVRANTTLTLKIGGDLAERYGYVNRSLPDSELDAFVESLAIRISTFDRHAIAETKHLVDIAILPPDSEIAAGWDASIASIQRPQGQGKIKRLMELGLQKNADVEERLPPYTGTLGSK